MFSFILQSRLRAYELNSFSTTQKLKTYSMKKFNYLLIGIQFIGSYKSRHKIKSLQIQALWSAGLQHQSILTCSPANQTINCHLQSSLFLVVCYYVDIYLQYQHEMWLLWRSTAFREKQNNSFCLIIINSKTSNLFQKRKSVQSHHYTVSSLATEGILQ